MATYASLNKGNLDWVARNLEGANLLVATFASEHADRPITLEALDRTWDAWLATSPSDSDVIDHVLNFVGCQFGQFLVDQAGFEWTIVTDEFGTDLGVRALPDRGDVLVCPLSFVVKRWEARTANFFAQSFLAIVGQVGAIKSDWDCPKP
ncbi:hypothetical protein AYO47_08275 [Planctomyces sp. SCGC AG-212-M04]|nr:hypothetical protein AYO47_08275 [Planctomyces sp. SCGC AG-212-M04]